MKLEAGKWYKTRGGLKVKIDYVSEQARQASGHTEAIESMHLWWIDGNLVGGGGEEVTGDLVSEWTEPPPVGSSAWANSLTEGTKVRLSTWVDGTPWALRKGDQWYFWNRLENKLSFYGYTHSITGDSWSLYTEPKLRPWRMDEVPLGAWLTMEGKAGRYLITGAKEVDLVVAGVGGISYEHARDTCKVSTDGGKTWLPCGVEE